MAFTSKQLDALQQRAEADDALLQAFAQDYPDFTARVQADGQWIDQWANSNPALESKL